MCGEGTAERTDRQETDSEKRNLNYNFSHEKREEYQDALVS
jgi:hypothetical protein